jgi:hypothetical protein
MKKQNKKTLKKFGVFFGVFLLFLIAFFVFFYFSNPLNKFNRAFFKTIPYPVALVDGKIITTRNLIKNTESIENFYSNQDFSELGLRVDFKTEEGQFRLKVKEKEILNKLIEDQIIVKIARARGIEVSEKEAGDELITKAQEAGNTENLAINLKRLYNWSLSDFRDKVILPRLHLKSLISYYENEEKNKNEPEIEKAYKELENNITFEEVAKKYSKGENAQNGGSIGWFKKEYLSDAIAEKVVSMEPGEYSEIIKTSLGSHIIYLEEVKDFEGEKEFKLRQIFNNENSFLSWLEKEKSNFSVKIFIKDYYWDEENNFVRFSDKKIEERELDLRNKSEGDPSFY